MNDDTISRQAAINSQIKMIAQGLEWVPVFHLEQLPSAERHGRWEETEYSDYDGSYRCSACGEVWDFFINGTPKDNGANYCPMCGASMEEVNK